MGCQVKLSGNFFGISLLIDNAIFCYCLIDKQMFLLSSIVEISKRIQFAFQNSLNFSLIRDVGAGKSTSLCHALFQLLSKRYHVIDLVDGQ